MRSFKSILIVLLIVVFCFSLAGKSQSQSDGLVLEWEQHWDTYGVGGTCNFGTHNFFVGDVDSDGVIEIVTGGMEYNISDNVMTERMAPFMIWNWNGEKFTLESSYTWTGVTFSIFAEDADNDGTTEIITGGRINNSTGSYASLRMWNHDGEVLSLKDSCEGGIGVSSIFVSDLNKDGEPEILTAGSVSNDGLSNAQLGIWHWDGINLALKQNVEWCAANGSSANSVYAYDLDDDDDIEIITGGYDNGLKNSSGQIRVWNWNGTDLSLELNAEWRLVEGVYGETSSGGIMGNTLVNNVKVDDVDSDGYAEIVTGGFAYDGEKVNAQLRIWNWVEHNLVLEESREWTTEDITEIKALTLEDVDGDSHVEIVTGGLTSVSGGFYEVGSRSQLRVWSWDGKTLTLKQNKDWTIGDGVSVWSIATEDVDDDGTIEILTVGCMGISNLCDPDLRIWSIAKETVSLPYLPFVVIGIVIAVLFVLVYFFVIKRRG